MTAVADVRVAKAMRFIRRQHLGRTIAGEINRRRVEEIARLLAVTNRSIAQIAEDIGYSSDRHIGRYFHRQTGLTPQKYRLRHGGA